MGLFAQATLLKKKLSKVNKQVFTKQKERARQCLLLKYDKKNNSKGGG